LFKNAFEWRIQMPVKGWWRSQLPAKSEALDVHTLVRMMIRYQYGAR
jgi:hypothetical protein